jgi:hypothetical protein
LSTCGQQLCSEGVCLLLSRSQPLDDVGHRELCGAAAAAAAAAACAPCAATHGSVAGPAVSRVSAAQLRAHLELDLAQEGVRSHAVEVKHHRAQPAAATATAAAPAPAVRTASTRALLRRGEVPHTTNSWIGRSRPSDLCHCASAD